MTRLTVEDAVERELWLAENRCPFCIHGDGKADGCARGYKRRRTHDGWRCYGYRSKLPDERRW